ncbi:G2-specific serine/threonine protein kinase [Tulasnella sp. 419]|nr:G2-specific serine/threonine protein kinase [Tulasnella sp. 419]
MNQHSWLDDYEAGDIIGNGSFGIIRKVKRKSDGTILARKELRFEKMTEKDRKQIVAEVNILKDLNHENIVRYIDRWVDRENGILYILMEYCGGGDLGSLLSKSRKQCRPLPEDTVWRYFFQILQALQHCHCPNAVPDDPSAPKRTHQILHRDIKPENVFLTSDDNVKLGDFGLSKQMTYATFANTYVGTPYYMSPEMMNEKAYDAKSDIWSLGCLIYELCALQPPFAEAKTHAELAMLIKRGHIPPLPRGYSSSLSHAIRGMLNLTPNSRPSVQTLLQHERFQQIRSQIETGKLLREAKVEQDRIHSRERAVATREEEVRRLAQKIEADRLAIVEELRLERNKINEERTQLHQGLKALADDRERYDELCRNAREEYATFSREKMEFEKQKEELEKARRKFEDEKAAWLSERAKRQNDGNDRKTPFDDVQNQKNTIPLPSIGGQSTKNGSSRSSRRTGSQDQNIPPNGVLDPRHNTPQNRRLASRSNPNLGSAMKGIVYTATGQTIVTPDQEAEEEIPPVPPLPSVIPSIQHLLCDAQKMADSPEAIRQLSTSESSSGVRVRRRSTVTGASRPSIAHVSSAPTGIPASTWNPSNLPPAPVYDLDDEENLPSPFLKRNTTKASVSSGWGSLKAGLKKGPGLLGLATANSALASKD